MCGIVGCILKRPLDRDDLTLLRSIRDVQGFRGPDDRGEYVSAESGVYLGHLRLAIVDLNSRSSQPMQRDGIVIAFNGELYNFAEIRKGLDSSLFSTMGDTEVILRSWQAWGDKCVDLFDGMFAFALYDGQTLTLVTDPFGEKPMYIFENQDGVYFSSEAGPLIEAFKLKFEPTTSEVSEFLNLGYILPPGTGFKNLSTVKPASILRYNQAGNISGRTYWEQPEAERPSGRIRPVTSSEQEDIKDALCTSLERRLNCDVEKGIFLSGGVDSVLLAALISRELGQSIDAYTVAFPDGGNEAKHAVEIARDLGLKHTLIDSRDSDLWVDLPSTLKSLYSVPNDNATSLAVFQMCEHVKKFMTVAISGLGGDELFMGYHRYRLFDRLRLYYKYSRFIWAALRPFSGASHRLDVASKLLKGDRTDQFLAVKNSGFDEQISSLGLKNLDGLLGGAGDLLGAVRRYDLTTSMPQSYIPAIERGSMRASVEVRAPFLSRNLVDAVNKLDHRALIRFGAKKVLRNILSEYVDLDKLFKGKQGFIFPAQRYFGQEKLPNVHVPQLKQKAVDELWKGRNSTTNFSLLTRLAVLSEFNQSNTK